MYLTVGDYAQPFNALHGITDYFGNKRSVSEKICGAEHEFGTTTGLSLSWFKIQGSLYKALKGGILAFYQHSAFYSLLI